MSRPPAAPHQIRESSMNARSVPLAMATLCLMFSSVIRAEDSHDRFKVPAGDSASLVSFINGLKSFRPKTSEELAEHRRRLPIAVRKAAEKILELEEDRQSPTARIATENLLDLQIQALSTASPTDQSRTLEQLKQYVMSANQLTRSELVMSIRAASALERTGQSKLASEGYETFGEMFAQHADEQLATYGKKMLGVSRRLNLLGNELRLEGDTLSGEPFDWASYRGKVVLVDFWATWCEPCVAELPNIKKHFEEYHDRGFEVVAISVDRDRRKLEEFVHSRDLPWVTLFRDGAGLDHPLATYYGVMTVPTVMLVNQEGRVVSFDVKGPKLTRHLAGLLGPK